ncbi:MAG: DinB family protein [candidate division Zixibacteria bacterium]|nr:DinB family protein [candidate division Zixibacteria bacterium]
MNAASIDRTLLGLIAHTQTITENFQSAFGGLSTESFNWKPGPDRWSVGQCIEHLVTTNEAYFPTLEAISAGTHSTPLCGYIPFMTGWWGSTLIGWVDPANRKKSVTPSTFQPSSSNIEPKILASFADQQIRFISCLKTLEGKNLKDIVIASPAAGFITLTLDDALTLIVLHNQRHFDQATLVTKTEGFPAL